VAAAPQGAVGAIDLVAGSLGERVGIRPARPVIAFALTDRAMGPQRAGSVLRRLVR
jgi:hypothetical protein